MQKKIWFIFLLLIILIIPIILFDVLGERYELDQISKENIVNYTNKLTSEEFNGRFVGTDGHKYTQEYIISTLEEMGYVIETQEFNVIVTQISLNPNFEIGDKKINEYDYSHAIGGYSTGIDFEGELVFLDPASTKYDSEIIKLNGELVKNRLVVIMDGTGITNTVIETLRDAGCAGILLGNESYYDYGSNPFDVSLKVGKSIPIIYLGDNVVNELLELASNSTEEVSQMFYAKSSSSYNSGSNNLVEKSLGVVKNIKIKSDLNFKMETGKNIFASLPTNDNKNILLLSSNYDGVGALEKDSFEKGTFSNATSVAFNLSLADRIKNDYDKTNQKVVFAFFDATIESGKGSEYYIENPIYNLEDSTIMVFDALGASALEIFSINEKGLFIENELLQYANRQEIHVRNAYAYDYLYYGSSDFFNFSNSDATLISLGSYLGRSQSIFWSDSEELDINNLESPIKLMDYYFKESLYNDYFPDYFNKFEWTILILMILGLYILIIMKQFRYKTVFNINMSKIYYSIPYSIFKNLYNIVFIFIVTSFIILGISQLPSTFDIKIVNNNLLMNHSFYSLLNEIIFTIRNLISSGFGVSDMGIPHIDIIIENSIRSFTLLSISIIIAIILGLLIGILSSYFKKSMNSSQSFIVILGLSIPEVVIAFLLIIYFRKIVLLPFISNIEVSKIRTVYMPIFTMSFIPIIYISRIIYTTLVEELNKKYIVSLKAKGVTKFRLYKNHLFKICFARVLEIIPILLSIVITNMILCEYIFNATGITSNIFSALEFGEFRFFLGLTISIMFYYYIVLLLSQTLLKVIIPKSGGIYEVE